MKRVVLVVVGVALVFLLLNRERVYVRDPLASLYRNDVRQSGVRVSINYSNDVLLERDEEPGAYRILVQEWNKMPGTPVVLRCLRWTACLTDADHAATLPMEWSGKGKYDPQVAMSSRKVSYVDGDGARVRVTLR